MWVDTWASVDAKWHKYVQTGKIRWKADILSSTKKVLYEFTKRKNAAQHQNKNDNSVSTYCAKFFAVYLTHCGDHASFDNTT